LAEIVAKEISLQRTRYRDIRSREVGGYLAQCLGPATVHTMGVHAQVSRDELKFEDSMEKLRWCAFLIVVPILFFILGAFAYHAVWCTRYRVIPCGVVDTMGVHAQVNRDALQCEELMQELGRTFVEERCLADPLSAADPWTAALQMQSNGDRCGVVGGRPLEAVPFMVRCGLALLHASVLPKTQALQPPSSLLEKMARVLEPFIC
jgi:hypothetical protein